MKFLVSVFLAFFSSISYSNEIKLVVSSGVGGITHKYALEIVPIISRATGKPVVIEIKAGAEGYIAANYVYSNKQKETVLLIGTPQRWTEISNKNRLSHSRDFITVSYLGYVPSILASSYNRSFDNVSEFLEFGKQNKVSYGISANNPLRPALKRLVETHSNPNNVLEITYKSGNGAVMDLVGNHIDVAVSGIENFDQFIQEKKLKALGIVSSKRQSNILTLSDQNLMVEDEFKYYPNVFLWANLSADKQELDKITTAMNRFLLTEESSKVRRDMFITYDPLFVKNPKDYLTKILE